jgi:DNA-binding MarR family transcriptional regulator
MTRGDAPVEPWMSWVAAFHARLRGELDAAGWAFRGRSDTEVLLAAIAEAEGASQSDLVRTTGVDRSTLAEMMARMEKKGLIARAASADDGRAKSVRLTNEGRRRLDAVLPAIKDVDRHLLAALPATRRAAFQTILAELAEAADSKMSEEAPAKPMRRKAAGPKTPVARKRVKARAKR